MAGSWSVVVIGGTSGIGREVARFFADRGREVVISSREAGRARDVASEIGGRTAGIGMDLARPHEIANMTMRDVVGAVVFLLENASMNGVNLRVDGGWLLL